MVTDSNTDNFPVTLSNGEATVEVPDSCPNETHHEETHTVLVSEISGKCQQVVDDENIEISFRSFMTGKRFQSLFLAKLTVSLCSL